MAQQLGKRLDWKVVRHLTTPVGQPKITLAPNQLHLWQVPLMLSEQQSGIARQLLNEHQRSKHQRRREPSQQQAYLAGRYYLFQLLSLYTQRSVEHITLNYGRLNKPSLANEHSTIQFNYTDTRIEKENIGLFAFSLDLDLGVDIEARNRDGNFTAIARKRFAPAELEFANYNEQTDTIDAERCLAIWTRKEAYGKAIGLGINFKMNQHDLAPTNDPFELQFTDQEKRAWRLHQLECDHQFIACVVHAGHAPLQLKAFKIDHQMVT